MTFKVGDKVRCIAPNTAAEGSPKLGEVYTVVRVYRATHPESGGLLLHVDKLGGWFASRFELANTTPHKWAKEIKAWADGATIQVSTAGVHWSDVDYPRWILTQFYRVKPEKKPDVVLYGEIVKHGAYATFKFNHASPEQGSEDNVYITFDGETGKLKAVQLLSPSLDRS